MSMDFPLPLGSRFRAKCFECSEWRCELTFAHLLATLERLEVVAVAATAAPIEKLAAGARRIEVPTRNPVRSRTDLLWQFAR